MPNKECYWRNPEYYREKSREYHTDNAFKTAKACKAWVKKNPNKAKAIKRRYYLKNKEQVIERSIQRRRILKKKCVNYLGGICNKCKLKTNCLDVYCFHHKDSSKKDFSISQRRTSTFEKIKNELDKCKLLCANCHRKEHRSDKMDRHTKYRQRRKEKAISMFDGICADCKLQDDVCIYDFHHFDFSKKDFIFGDNRGWEKTEKELLKCVMLCANCHKIRHANKPLQGFNESSLK